MERKQFITAMTLSVLVFALWLFFNSWYEKHHPQPVVTETPAATQPATVATSTTNPAATTNPTTTPSISAPTISPALSVQPATQPAAGLVLLGSAKKDDPTYALQLALTPDGAAVADVTLNNFPAPRDEHSPKVITQLYQFETPLKDHENTRVLATRTLTIDDKPIDLWNVRWTRESSDSKSATFYVVINDAASQPLVKVIKTYTLQTREEAKTTGKGYEVAVSQTIENLRTDRSIKIKTVINGPTPPPAEIEQGNDRNVVVGYQEGNSITDQLHAFTDFKPDNPAKDLTKDGSKQYVWAGQASSYFGAIVLPGKPGDPQFTLRAEALDPSAEIERNVAITFSSADITLAPGQKFTAPMSVFFGPKWRDVLGDNYYSSFPRMYQLLLVVSSRMCGWCTFGWLIVGLVKLLNAFHWVTRDWGLAIICLVLLVRLLLHPITKRSQVQMMKMGKLSPEVEKLKKKYADQPDVLNREMMKLYKQQGGAILGCLPMFLQTPIWIALWTALQGTFELRQAPFLHGWTWIKDLSKPDDLVHFGGPIHIIFFTIYGINILPLLMAAVTYINQKYFMPMPIAATPEQEQQQKMQRGMSLIFPLMFYTLPSGLNLYYLTSMSLGILESKIIRDHIKEQEELEKLQGPEIVAVKATRGARRGGGDRPDDDKPSKPGLFERFAGPFMDAMRKAQEQAEQMKKDQGKGKKK